MLKPLTALFGPIFAKEMVEMARRPRYFFNRLVYVTALLAVSFVVWQDYGWVLQREGPVRALPKIADAIFVGIVGVQYAAVYLFVPIFLMAVIAGEREQKTLDLVLTTDLTDREIVLGKLASRLAVLVLLFLAAMPLLSLIGLVGGLDYDVLWRCWMQTLLAMLLTGATSIYFTTVSRSPLAAALRTYWWLGIWLVLLPVVTTLLLELLRVNRSNTRLTGLFFAQIFLNPVIQFLSVFEPPVGQALTWLWGDWGAAAGFFLPGLVSVVLISLAIRRLRPLEANSGGNVALWSRYSRWREERRLRRAERRRTWAPTFRNQPVENPLWLRSRLALVYDREGYIDWIQSQAWLFAGGILLLILLIEPRAIQEDDLQLGSIGMSWIAVGLLIALVSATSFLGDRRRGLLDLLLTTPLSAAEIVGGTYLAVWEHVRKGVLLPIALTFFFAATGRGIGLPEAVASVTTAVLFGVLLTSFGLVFSLSARSFPLALTPAIAFAPVTWIALLWWIETFEELHGPGLWFLCLVVFAISASRVSQWKAPVGLAVYFATAHVWLSLTLTFWTIGNRKHYPGAAFMTPFVVMAPLESTRWYDGSGHWLFAITSFWLAMALQIAWMRSWLIRHFEELARAE